MSTSEIQQNPDTEVDAERIRLAVKAANVYCNHIIYRMGPDASDPVRIHGHSIALEEEKRDPLILTELAMTLSNDWEKSSDPDIEKNFERPRLWGTRSVLLTITKTLHYSKHRAEKMVLPCVMGREEYKAQMRQHPQSHVEKIIQKALPHLFAADTTPANLTLEATESSVSDIYAASLGVLLEKIKLAKTADDNLLLVVRDRPAGATPHYNFNIFHVYARPGETDVKITAIENHNCSIPRSPQAGAPGIAPGSEFTAHNMDAAIRLCAQLSSLSNKYMQEADQILGKLFALQDENLRMTRRLHTSAQQEQKRNSGRRGVPGRPQKDPKESQGWH